jgi:heme-degrading monooxygenase HmoA
MNAATLARMKVISGTTEELINSIKESTKTQRFSGLIESVIYRLPDNPEEILALSMWDSLRSLPNFEENYKRPANQEITTRSRIISRQTYKLVKDFRTVSSSVGASHIRLMTFHTSEPEKRLKQAIDNVTQIRAAAAGLGHVGVWMGRLVEEPTSNTLSLLSRHDWRSAEDQRAFLDNSLTKSLRAQNQAEGTEVVIAAFNLDGLVRLEQLDNRETIDAVNRTGRL